MDKMLLGQLNHILAQLLKCAVGKRLQNFENKAIEKRNNENCNEKVVDEENCNKEEVMNKNPNNIPMSKLVTKLVKRD